MSAVPVRKAVELAGKSGKSLARFFPEIVSLIARLSPDSFALDGELVVTGDGAPSFDALQMRLHPSESRIKRLSQKARDRDLVRRARD